MGRKQLQYMAGYNYFPAACWHKRRYSLTLNCDRKSIINLHTLLGFFSALYFSSRQIQDMIQPTDWLGSTGVAGYFLELFSNQPFFFNFFFSVVQKLNIPSNDLWGSFGPYTVACTFVTVATDLLGVITVHFVIFDFKLSEEPFLFRMSVIFT